MDFYGHAALSIASCAIAYFAVQRGTIRQEYTRAVSLRDAITFAIGRAKWIKQAKELTGHVKAVD